MVAQQLIRNGRTHHAQLGISVADGIAARGTQQMRSAMVASVVVGSPAHKSGLQVGDHIISIDGVATTSALSLVGHVRGLPVGKSVNLLVVRDGTSIDARELKEHLKPYVELGMINKWAIPSQIALVTEIPKTSVGKLNKREMRESLDKLLA